MPSTTLRVLLVSHVAAAAPGARAAREVFGAAAGIDVLCYGRASEDLPGPPGTRLIALPVQEGMALMPMVRMLVGVRRGGYDVVALCQPALGFSRGRAILMTFSLLVGGPRTVILDPVAARVVRPVTVRLAGADLVRWAGIHGASRLLAVLAPHLLQRLSRRDGPEPRRVMPRGSVVYLRTDIELRVAPLRAGGSLAHTEGIVRALVNRGHAVMFWATGEVEGIPSAVPQRRLATVLKGNLPTEIAELVSGVVQGIRPPRGPRPTGFVYQRYSLNNFAGVILSKRWKVPLILEANGSEAKWRQDFSALKYSRLAYGCERLILRRAQVISAVSTNAAEDLLDAGAPRDRLRVVPNGVDVTRFLHADPMPLPALDGTFVVCFVGLFYPWHGTRYLAEAFALLHRRRPDARLLLVGDGEEAPAVRSVLERGGALEATSLTGLVPRADAPRYMAAADVLVSPHANVDHFIGSPIKLFEYMAAGKAIVATRVAQIPEVLRDSETALLVEPENPEAMAAALDRLYADRGLRRRLGEAARREAEQRHSWHARLEAVLDDVGTVASRAANGGSHAGHPGSPTRSPLV